MEKKTDYEALDISVITFEDTDIITVSRAGDFYCRSSHGADLDAKNGPADKNNASLRNVAEMLLSVSAQKATKKATLALLL